MIDRNRGGPRRRHSWRIGRVVCGVAAVVAVLAGVAVIASAQVGPTAPVTANPPLTAACGLKVQLVLDESGSIVSPNDEASSVRASARGFVSALAGTGSDLAITAFQRTARPLIGYTPVTAGNVNTFFSWINGRAARLPGATQQLGYYPESPPRVTGGVFGPGPTASATSRIDATNWDDALKQVGDVPAGPPNLVVFITDGDPTTYNTGATRPPVGTNTGTATPSTAAATVQASLAAAVPSANAVKEAGSRIFAIGVGPAAGTGAAAADSRERLQRISGPNQFTGTEEFHESDYTAVSFDQLEDKLTSIISDLCGGSLTVTKHVLDPHGEPVEPAAGWRFDTTLSPAGGHNWVHPEQATDGSDTGPTASLTTAADGIARFEWTLHDSDHQVTASVQKFERDGFDFVAAQCTTNHRDGSSSTVTDATGIPSATLGPDDWRTCDVINRQHAATLDVIKRVVPSDDPGEFDLLVNGMVEREAVRDGGSTGPITLPLGTHTVSETGANGTDPADYATTIECVDANHGDRVVVGEHAGTSVHVPLVDQGEAIVCTITNTSRTRGQITVIKHLIPHGDSGRFNLLVNGALHAHGVGDGGTTGPVLLPFGTHEVTEHGAGGTSLSHFDISTTCIDESTGDEVSHNPHGPAVSVHLTRRSDSIQCTITNARPGVRVARLEVVKHLVPQHAGLFNLLVGGTAFALGVGHHGSTGPLEFELGRHQVTEHGVHGTDLADFSISTTCVDTAHGDRRVAHDAHGPSVSVDLTSESEHIVCTITNRLTRSPAGNGGMVPVPPGPDPHLAVVKTIRAHAQVGELVPITIAVHNHGHGTAHEAELRDAHPAGMRIVDVADHGTIQRNGTAVWKLGTLAPGESRTVHATARVLHTGLHVDTAVATARNADPALSDAAVRVLAATKRHRTPPRHHHRKHHPPRFTG